MTARLRIALLALVAALAAAPSAGAHAVLVTTAPQADAVLAESPRSITLYFSEPVETAFGAVAVYDESARRVDTGAVTRPADDTVSVTVDGRLARGTYTVAWRAVSADAHPIRGAFVFHVGAPGANPEGVGARVGAGGAGRTVSGAFALVRFLDFALLLAATGGAIALATVLASADVVTRRQLFMAVAVLAAALVPVALAGIWIQGASARGASLGSSLRWDVYSEVLATRFGRAWLTQAAAAAALAAAAVAARARPRLALATVGPAAVVLVTPSLAGHAAHDSVAMTADVLHVAAAAVWTGGLAFAGLALALAHADRWRLAGRIVPRFSDVAVSAVAALLVAGAVNGYQQVGTWEGLWETRYGQLLLAKLALVAPLIALGVFNNRYAVPRLRRGLPTAPERRRFVRALGGELVLVAGVVAVTAILVAAPPARTAVGAAEGPFSTTAPIGPLHASIVVEPASAGRNQIHIALLDAHGQPAEVAGIEVSASLPSRDVGPLMLPVAPAGPGHVIVPRADLAVPGTWLLRLEVERGELGEDVQTVPVPIRDGT